MDKFKYVATHGQYAGATPPPTHTTGWLFSDAVIQSDCPKCGSHAGYFCETKGGRKAWPPHFERQPKVVVPVRVESATAALARLMGE